VITTQQEDKFISTKEQTQAKSGPRDSYYHEDDPGSHTLSIPSISPPPPPLPPRAGLPLNSPCPSAADNQLQPPPLPPKTGLDHDQQYRALRSHGEMLNEPNSHSIQVQLLSEARNSGQHYHTKLLPASDFSPVMTGSYEQHHAPHVVTNVTTGELSRQGPPWQMSTTHLIDEPGHIDGARKPTAPPVPPNPHKQSLIQKVLEKKAVIRRSDAKQENSTLHGIAAQREAMLACEKELQAEMQTLSRLSSILESNTSILHHALEQADITISNSQNHPPPDIDDLLVAPTVVANQLYSLVADDRAIEDTVFFISRSLEKGSISVSTFVKSTRTISREWFLKKALIQKISVGMGLVCTSR
jgi:ESCRT-I complex subunit TSG101